MTWEQPADIPGRFPSLQRRAAACDAFQHGTGDQAMPELKALAGAAAICCSIVATWILLPRNGREHWLAEKSYFSAFVAPLIIAAAVLGIAFIVSALI